jgi:hypothetical protein
MEPVILESPFAGDVDANIEYAQKCMHDMLLRGEAPYASHLLYTQQNVLDDTVPEQRKLGIEAGFVWKHMAGMKSVAYLDHGMSGGMQMAKDYCNEHGLPWEERLLY